MTNISTNTHNLTPNISAFPMAGTNNASDIPQKLDKKHPYCTRNDRTRRLKSSPLAFKLNKVVILSRTIVLLFTFMLLVSTIQFTHQQNQLCPKTCNCNDQNLEIVCKEPIGASGLPHTLNPHVKRMIINYAQTAQLSGLDSYSDLEAVDLAFNKISSIDFNEINKNGKLLSLNVSHNSIWILRDTHTITAFEEVGMTKIIHPNNQDNLRVFRKLIKINVVELILSHNNLANLASFTFLRWHKLFKLDLSYNQISYLESESLFGLNKLETLNLRGNNLTQIPSTAIFSTIQSLSYPPLTDFPDKSRPTFLKLLDLGENQFVTIGPNSLDLLEKLQELHLDSCSVSLIDERAFAGLRGLQKLNLDDNNLLEIPTNSLAPLMALKSFRLNSNKLTIVKPFAFNQMPNLEQLLLNNNSIGSLRQDSFAGLYLLNRLELAYNQNLTMFPSGTLDYLPKLKYLSLYSSSLRSMPSSINSSSTNSLSLLDLRSNPLTCDCDLKWLTFWLKSHFDEATQATKQTTSLDRHLDDPERHSMDDLGNLLKDVQLIQDLKNLTCAGPPALFGRLVIELPDNKLECLEPSSDLNVQIGYATLFSMIFIMTFVCLVNLCRNKKHLFTVLKESMLQNHMSLMQRPYQQNLHKNVDELRKETQLDDYESVDYNQQMQVYTLNRDQPMYCEPDEYSQHI